MANTFNASKRADFSCIDCDKRYPGCHTVCDDYIRTREQRDKSNDRKRPTEYALYASERKRRR